MRLSICFITLECIVTARLVLLEANVVLRYVGCTGVLSISGVGESLALVPVDQQRLSPARSPLLELGEAPCVSHKTKVHVSELVSMAGHPLSKSP
ncbi:hypothetical protein EDD17DRAFT_1663795 [Pisolithus thermaeus]|nr:hypothetical protein EDD17DRAFT_1663795 [Pisolithus thermaeus]